MLISIKKLTELTQSCSLVIFFMKNIFITATNTDIGKTHTTLLLIEKLSQKGLKVGVIKPIETGVVDGPNDGLKLYEKVKEFNKEIDITLKDIVPITFSLPAAPYVSKGNKKIDFDLILKAYKKIASQSDIVLIEGAGGLMVPVEKDFYMIDFIKMFDAHTLLVTPNSLGCINDTMLSLEILKQNNLKYTWCINHFNDNKENFKKVTLPFYKDNFDEVLSLQDDIEKIIKKLL